MLTALSIRDFVLIEQLDLQPSAGLTVLTGETGAGKSILLDALGAACGARAEGRWVRSGAEKASITACFDPSKKHPTLALLKENEIEASDGLILRRVIMADGRSKAFINDQAVGVSLLKQIGALLLEVHGQFDTHGLLDASTHLGALDRFAGIDPAPLRNLWQLWQAARGAEQQAQAELERALAEADYLREAVTELRKLAPQPGEEAKLIEQKQFLQNREKLATGLTSALEALQGEAGAESAMANASKALGKIADKAGERAAQALAQLDTARDALAEAINTLTSLNDDVEDGPQLEQVEDRLYALRAAARKHQVLVEELATAADALTARLELLDNSTESMTRLSAATIKARGAYEQMARSLSAQRKKAATQLDKRVNAELTPLKLERAKFSTALREAEAGPNGIDAVQFEVATNIGQASGPLHKIASGGELARFMLALKAVLAQSSDALTLIFDEVDQGVGGAVAAAVGERLAKLGTGAQVLVVTHSPQVAAKGAAHWKVAKQVSGKHTLTTVTALDERARREELARMLAGETVTEASRQAAEALLA
jgi:DNA repair protein RecN (Recombination protein N)